MNKNIKSYQEHYIWAKLSSLLKNNQASQACDFLMSGRFTEDMKEFIELFLEDSGINTSERYDYTLAPLIGLRGGLPRSRAWKISETLCRDLGLPIISISIPIHLKPIVQFIDEYNVTDLDIRLNKLVGLLPVKSFLKKLEGQIKINNERKKLELVVPPQTLNMIFGGNPGTGKTTVARFVSELLYNMGVITKNVFVEVDRTKLVAGYIGQTSKQTEQIVMSALGGVLFIDEAYTLSEGGENDFGKEAINTLLKMMEDYRDQLIVIIAGYSNEIDKFLEVNPGLQSRFSERIDFPDYTVDELLYIADGILKKSDYTISVEAKEKMRTLFQHAKNDGHFGNARYVRNIIEKSLRNQAERLSFTRHNFYNRSILMEITEDDIPDMPY